MQEPNLLGTEFLAFGTVLLIVQTVLGDIVSRKNAAFCTIGGCICTVRGLFPAVRVLHLYHDADALFLDFHKDIAVAVFGLHIGADVPVLPVAQETKEYALKYGIACNRKKCRVMLED